VSESTGPPRVALLTVLAGLVLLAFVVLTTWLSYGRPRVDGVPDPEEALAVVVGRTLELDEALERTSPGERRLWGLLLSDRQQDLAESIVWYAELLEISPAPRVALRLVVLEAEDGRLDAVRRAVAEWRRRDAPFPDWADLVSVAYLGATSGPGQARALEALRAEDWFTDRLALRWAERTSDRAMAQAVATALATRGGRRLTRLRWYMSAHALLLVAGVGALTLGRRRLRGPLADGIVPAPWRGSDGMIVLVRGGAIAAVTIVAGSLWASSSLGAPWNRVVLGVATSLALVPMVLLARYRLLAPTGSGLATALGLGMRPGRMRSFLLVVVVVLGAGQLGDVASDFVARAFGLVSHWTEWFDPDLALGAPSVLGVVVLDSVVITPVLEEIVFRGLVFSTLRCRLSLVTAAPLSAAIFAAAHGYGASGLLAVFCSGLVWAVAYEKTKSLLPSIVAHAVGNLNASLVVVLMFRS